MKTRTLVLSPLFLVVLIMCLQTPIATAVVVPPPPPAELLWMDPIDISDIALSKDGRYVAAVGPIPDSAELRFYGRSSGTPIWTYSATGDFYSVAISADGDCVAIGTGRDVRFWKNARSLSGIDSSPTWTSVDLGGPIEYRCLDISDDGNYLVACGTGPGVFYWADAKAKSGNDVSLTWHLSLKVNAEAVDLSSDGDYVVVGTTAVSGHAGVAYWKNARTLNDYQIPAWMSTEPINSVLDVAVSDDGEYIAAASEPTATLYYWAGAKSLDDDPEATWQTDSDVHFSSVDMSSDGDKVVAGGFNTTSAESGVYFWNGAKGMTGKPQKQTWTSHAAGYVWDVAINSAGDYMAAADGTRYVYFLDNKGSLKWQYGPLFNTPFVLSISSDGGTLAIGTGLVASRYLVSTGYRTPTPRAVGGILLQADKLALLSPWLAVALAAVAVTVFAAKRRKP